MYVRRHGRFYGAADGGPAHVDVAKWWIGAELVCPECACHFTLEEGDEEGLDLTPGCWGQGVWRCPECTARVVLDELQLFQPPAEDEEAPPWHY